MNGLNSLANRMGKVEDKLTSGDRPSPLVLFSEPGESDEDVFARHNLKPDPSRDVMIISWLAGPPIGMNKADIEGFDERPPTPKPESIDDEIEKLFSELEQAGFSRDEVTRMVRDGKDLIREPEKAVEPEAPMPAPPEPPSSIEAPKAPDLNRLFGGRR